MSKHFKKLIEIKNNNKKIALIGIGVELKQFLNWLINEIEFNPENIILIDQKEIEESVLKNIKKENIFSNQESFKIINEIKDLELVIKAPGIWSLKNDFVDFRKLNGKYSVISSMTYFIEKHQDKIIGITGTKGKTTTASLLYHFLKDEIDINYCGNSVGISPYKFWSNVENNSNKYFIIEMSSFQLQDLGNAELSPDISIITNLFFDHQDVHHSIDEYWTAKENIYKFHKDDKTQTSIISEQLLTLDKYKNSEDFEKSYIITADFVEYLIKNFKSKLVGNHNYSNLAGCLFAFYLFKAKIDKQQFKTLSQLKETIQTDKNLIQKKLDTFTPVKYRMELVYEVKKDDIVFKFYNDVQGTAVESSVYAIDCLSQNSNELLILLTGGKAKNKDFSLLIEMINSKLKSHKILDLFVFDEIGDLIKNDINYQKNVTTNTREFFSKGNLDLAAYSKILEESGIDTVNILLSPAGSSFNEFQNYIEKGEMFNEWAKSHQ